MVQTTAEPITENVQQRVTAIIRNLEAGSNNVISWVHNDLIVTTPEEQKNAEDLLIAVRQASIAADAKRKEILHPINEARDKVQQLFKPYLDRLDMARLHITRQLAAYHDASRRAAEEAKNLLLEQQAQRIAEARHTGELIEPPTLSPDPLPQTLKTSRANLGTVTYRETLDVSVVNAALIPRDLLMPDIPRIKARIQSGVQVPGVLATKRLTPVTRPGP